MPIIVPTTTGLTFVELLDEFYRRGFKYLDSSDSDRAKRWINQAYVDLCLEDEWPFLITTASGTAPLDVPDVREIHSVTSPTSELSAVDWDDLNNADPQLTQTGAATSYWHDGSALHVYPVDTGTSWTVRYLAMPADMVADTDEPVVPPQWRLLITDYAVIRALRDRSNYQEADALYQAVQPDLNRMREALVDLPWTQKITDPVA